MPTQNELKLLWLCCSVGLNDQDPNNILVGKYIDRKYIVSLKGKSAHHLGKCELYVLLDLLRLPDPEKTRLFTQLDKLLLRMWADYVQRNQQHISVVLFEVWLEEFLTKQQLGTIK